MTEPQQRTWPRFGIKHLLYVLAVFAVSLGMFGGLGLVVAIAVLSLWRYAFYEQHTVYLSLTTPESDEADRNAEPRFRLLPMPNKAVIESYVVLLFALILLSLLWLADVNSLTRFGRERERLQSVSDALSLYHVNHGSFPPAYTVDGNGRPLHSWRVLILPELGYQRLYNEFELTQPWDSAANAELIQQIPLEYIPYSLDHNRTLGQTNLLAPIGERAAWLGAEARTRGDFQSPGLMLVECERISPTWTAPTDIAVDQAATLLTQRPEYPTGNWAKGFFSSSFHGRMVFTSEAACRRMLSPKIWAISPADRRDLLETFDISRKDQDPEPFLYESRIPRWFKYRYDNWIRLLLFLLVVGLPAWPLNRLVRRHRQAALEAARQLLEEQDLSQAPSSHSHPAE